MYVLGYIMEILTVILKVFKQIGFKHGSGKSVLSIFLVNSLVPDVH